MSHSNNCLLFWLPEREKTQCERHRESAQAATSSSSIFSFFRPRPAVGNYVPQCDEHGAYEPTQCHTSISQCWCVDANGQEIPNTRTGPGSTPLCESSLTNYTIHLPQFVITGTQSIAHICLTWTMNSYLLHRYQPGSDSSTGGSNSTT